MTQERRQTGSLQLFFLKGVVAYRWGVGVTPIQSVGEGATSGMNAAPDTVHRVLLDQLWQQCDASGWGLSEAEFRSIVDNLAATENFGLPRNVGATVHQQGAWFAGLKLNEVVLARACAAGNERAWERFVALYEQPLQRAAIAISGNETVGRDLAGQLYAELYGLTEREGRRRSPLESYKGRGSLLGWLRTTLAQRHVDHFRATRREEPLAEYDAPATDPAPEPQAPELKRLGGAVEAALACQPADVRFLLASYYIDGHTLAEIARVTGVHEATVSRKLHRAVDGLRKLVVRNLEGTGLSRRAALEAMGIDPRDLDINLKRVLQNPRPGTFQEKAAL